MNWFFAAIGRGLGLAWSHRWLFAVPVATLLLPVTIYAIRLPDTYQAAAVVRATEYSSGDTARDLPGQRSGQVYQTAATARDRLYSSEVLRAVVPVLWPDADPKDYRIVEDLSKIVEYDRLTDFSFEVAITDTDPETAKTAVNTLVKAFLEEERKGPLRRAETQKKFFEGEAGKAKTVFLEIAGKLDTFRTENAATLPEAKDAIDQELATVRTELLLQKQLATSAQRRVEFLTEQLTRRGMEDPGSVARPTTADEKQLELQLGNEQAAINDARKRLAEARRRWTEKHPNVRGIQTELNELKSNAKATVTALKAAREAADKRAADAHKRRAQGPLATLRSMRTEAQAEAQRANEQVIAFTTKMGELQVRVARIPATKVLLDPLLLQKGEAQKRLDALEKEARKAAEDANFLRESDVTDVTEFDVDRWAVAPTEPTGPRRMRYFFTAIAAGLLIGYGLIVLRRRFEESTVQDADDLASLLPGAMIVNIPMLPDGRGGTAGGAVAAHAARELVLTAWVVGCVGLSVLAIAVHRGLIEAPAWLSGLFGGAA